jgi:hypothetical protein
MKAIDPRFNLEEFMREAREYIIPEIMEAYLKGDTNTLKEWCSEAVRIFIVLVDVDLNKLIKYICLCRHIMFYHTVSKHKYNKVL